MSSLLGSESGRSLTVRLVSGGLVLAAMATVTAPVDATARPSSGTCSKPVISLSAATRTVRSKGYVRNGPKGWRPCSSLNVLLGIAAGSGDGYNQRAFLFYGQRTGSGTSAPTRCAPAPS